MANILNETRLHVSELITHMQNFGYFDYSIFILMLSICLSIGIYFGFYRSTTSIQQYLMGERQMQTVPVTLSLIASYISGISLLGIPTETYIYGSQFFLLNFGFILMALMMHYIYMPVFYKLELTSTYESLWLPVVIYMPALAFNQVTGINVHYITPIVCAICIFYTCVGGIKAVVWTDVVQITIMYGAQIFVAVKGCIHAGGIFNVFKTNIESGRIEVPNLNLDLFDRHTIWSLVIGGSVFVLQTSAVNQSMIQRYLSLSSLKSAKRALWLFVIGVAILNTLGVFIGLIIYTTYSGCDPITTQLAKRKDQLLPLLVIDVLGQYPGFTGLFVSGVFSAALSSLSTGLNSLAAVILEDFVRSFSKSVSEKAANIIMRSTVVILGIYCVALVFVVEQFGAVLQLSMSLAAISTGPSLGLFNMGILLPWINEQGAFYGGIISLACMSWLTLNVQAAIANGQIQFDEKPVSTMGCHYDFPNEYLNSTAQIIHTKDILVIYKLSYLWYTLLGALLSMFFGTIISYMTSSGPKKLNPKLFAPFLRKFIKKRNDKYFVKEMKTLKPLLSQNEIGQKLKTDENNNA